MTSGLLAIIAALGILFSSLASANVGEAFGFGSRNAGIAGADVSWGFDGYSAYTNPAGLAYRQNQRLKFSYAVIYMEPSFTPINGVIVQNQFTIDSTQSGNVDLNYRATFGQALGLSYHLLPDTMNLSFGLVTYLPFDQAAYLDTGNSFVPEYVLYRARTQRPQIEAGFGADLGNGLMVGLGLHIGFALTSNADATLQTDPTKTSNMRFSASMKPKAAPYLGVLYVSQADPGLFSLGSVLRVPLNSNAQMGLSTRARITTLGTAAFDFNFNAESALNYDPLTWELGASFRHSPHGRLSVQADYQFWSQFVPPVLNLTPADNSGLVITPSKNPAFGYRNVLIPRVGEEILLGSTTVRVGYSYRPSMIDGVPNDAGNYLDPPKHMISAGIGFEFKSLLGVNVPNRLDVHFAYHILKTQQVTKTAGNEGGNAGDQKIGAPGYTVGGKMIGGGLSLSVAL